MGVQSDRSLRFPLRDAGMTDFDNGLKSTPQAETLMSNLVSGERCWEHVGGGILGSFIFIEPHVGNENERYFFINRFQDYPKQFKNRLNYASRCGSFS